MGTRTALGQFSLSPSWNCQIVAFTTHGLTTICSHSAWQLFEGQQLDRIFALGHTDRFGGPDLGQTATEQQTLHHFF